MSELTYELKDITTSTKVGPQTVAAQVASNGLAYHRSIAKDDTEDVASVRLASCWTVTHVGSGLSLCWETQTFDNEDQCRRFIAKVDSLYDWTAQLPKPTKKIQREVQRIARETQLFQITYL